MSLTVTPNLVTMSVTNISTVNIYTVSQKNDTDVTQYNLITHQLIMVIYGRDVADGVCSQM